jgi:DNA mismatch repair protein MutS
VTEPATRQGASAAALTSADDLGSEPKPFESLLFDGRPVGDEPLEQPAFFADVNLDQIVDAVCQGREEHELAPIFFTRAPDLDTVEFRHEVFRDLESRGLEARLRDFATQMQHVQRRVTGAGRQRGRYQREAFFLDAVAAYCDAIGTLHEDLATTDLRSRGLRAFRRHLDDYVASEPFAVLRDGARRRRDELGQVTYTVHLHGGRVTVGRYDGEPDYSDEIEAVFERFHQGAVRDYLLTFRDLPDSNHVEVEISELVAKLFPEVFEALDRFCDEHRDFLDERVAVFARELQFYVGYLDLLEPLAAAGLAFCFPEVTDRSKEVFATDTFDLALANALVATGSPVVCNDFALGDPERIVVVSGPNQGGKTTFARTFGQLHQLAGVGCPVPGSGARLFFFDHLFTHFQQQEDPDELSGKLEHDLLRVHDILGRATGRSIIVLNEVFSSTTLHDARLLGRRVLEAIAELDALCVTVTFVDELASLPKTVSMVSTVDPDDPATRTFKVVRGPANGLAYALALAEKYRVTYEALRERLGG